jgi:2,4-dienoyl-CoA reductase-like NADH-dependent reductase (Old Yellow Enzyme family)
MLHSYQMPTTDCCQPAMTHDYRVAQASCTEASCKPASGATAWSAQQSKARSAGMSGAQMTATVFVSNGRTASA